MKKRWIIFGVSGLMLVVIVAGVLFLLHYSMASTSGRKKEFSTKRQFSDSSMGSGGESFRNSAASDGKVKEQLQQDNEWEDDGNGYQMNTNHHGYHGCYSGAGSDCYYSGSNDCYGNQCSLDEGTALGNQIADLAACLQGIRYEYGGEALPILTMGEKAKAGAGTSGNSRLAVTINHDDFGVDCSGFVKGVYKYYNINLSRTCKQQAEEGKEVKIKDIEPGDIVFYGADKNNITHCGIYLRDGKVIHSSAEAKKVIISDMNYRTIITVRRVV